MCWERNRKSGNNDRDSGRWTCSVGRHAGSRKNYHGRCFFPKVWGLNAGVFSFAARCDAVRFNRVFDLSKRKRGVCVSEGELVLQPAAGR